MFNPILWLRAVSRFVSPSGFTTIQDEVLRKHVLEAELGDEIGHDVETPVLIENVHIDAPDGIGSGVVNVAFCNSLGCRRIGPPLRGSEGRLAEDAPVLVDYSAISRQELPWGACDVEGVVRTNGRLNLRVTRVVPRSLALPSAESVVSV